MSEKRVKMIIDPDGTFSVEATGFVGNTCHQSAEMIAMSLNGTATKEEPREALPDNDVEQFLNI